MSGHRYVSTACWHELHSRCRRTCKFCPASCECGCHPAAEPQKRPSEATGADLTASGPRNEPVDVRPSDGLTEAKMEVGR